MSFRPMLSKSGTELMTEAASGARGMRKNENEKRKSV